MPITVSIINILVYACTYQVYIRIYMSIEIKGLEKLDSSLAVEVAQEAARLCVAQGITPAEAHTTGIRGAEYGAAVTLTVLREMGLLPNQDFDVVGFVETAHRITDESISPS